ncbi:MAG TPA: PQQ-dependent sugar dehydrogenase [Tahibacter sp.]|uniref:PQQ-dependent sugar dehydrogenase n=1 Tax=Tahibacter sp. TaxID=2056211 RepID=UPI002C72EA1B|nr:PQQ-dependent sugar dehydrogenase [Tahibacter sp.]HSX61540.1 PQQ-dependent sugar dehydrogenase [Tahibacter sp.]
MRLTSAVAAALLAAVSVPAAAAPPAGMFLARVPNASTTFSTPVALRAPNDGSGRLFVVEKGGNIRVIKNGAALPTPFLTLGVTQSSESGLLGLAFHPNFGLAGQPHNTEFYIFYTRPSGDPRLGTTPDQVVARYTVPSLTSDVANTNGTIILRLPDLAGNHNGGDIHFGRDGYLYISSGDSGDQNNPHGFAECLWKKPADNNRNSCGTNPSGIQYFMLGHMLRIDVDTRGGAVGNDMCGSSGISPAEYSIPGANPHVGTSNTCDEIWASGFRNPWRFSFDRLDHRLIIGDVGQGSWEEITVAPDGAGGLDHGWSRCEGRHYFTTPGSGTNCPSATSTIAPVIEYGHSSACAVTGGFVYRGPYVPMRGTYFYGDSCSSDLWWSESTGGTWDSGGVNRLTGLGTGSIYGFGEDVDGNIYITRSNGQIHRITTDQIFEDDFE